MKKYYQPQLTDAFLEENKDFASFFVFKSKKLAQRVFPSYNILEYTGNDIEKPTYIDREYYRSVYNVDIKPLEVLFSKKLGFKINFKSKVINPFDTPRLVICSQDIIAKTGLFALPLIYAEISTFSGGVINNEGKMWLSFNVAYKHKNGGTNGIKIADVYYDFNKPVKERWEVVWIDEK
jgi:hypothetical protein